MIRSQAAEVSDERRRLSGEIGSGSQAASAAWDNRTKDAFRTVS